MMQSAGEGHKSKKKEKKTLSKTTKNPSVLYNTFSNQPKTIIKSCPEKKFLYCSKCMTFSHQASSKGRRQASQFSNLQLCVLYIGGSYIPLVLN